MKMTSLVLKKTQSNTYIIQKTAIDLLTDILDSDLNN